MTGYEFLKCIQTNTYPKNAASKAGEDRSGQPIENTTAAEKQQALDWLVHDYGADVYISSNGIVAEGSNISAETAVQQSFTHLTQSLFGTSPEALVKSKNFDLTKNVAALQDKVDEAKAKNTAAEQKYKEASQAVEACNKDIEQCRQRLAQLTTNVSAGTQVNQDGAAAKAAAAVDYIQKDHKKIDSLSTSVNKVVGAPSSLDAFKKLDGLKLPSKPVNK